MRELCVNEMTHRSAKATDWEQDGAHGAAQPPALIPRRVHNTARTHRPHAHAHAHTHAIGAGFHLSGATEVREANVHGVNWRCDGGSARSRRGSCWFEEQLISGRASDKKRWSLKLHWWHIPRVAFTFRTAQCFDFYFLFLLLSFQRWLKSSGKKENKQKTTTTTCASFLGCLLFSFVTVQQVVIFVCNIIGFVVGAFPFINVHWCSRKRGGDKVGERHHGEARV